MKISYDYDDLIRELKEDLAGWSINLEDKLKIVRGEPRYDYRPIVDYYYEYHDPKEDYEIKTVEEVLKEMEEMNKIL